MQSLLVFAAATVAAGALLSAQTLESGKANGRRNRPRRFDSPIDMAGPGDSPVNYNGGPVMLGQTHIYYIYYGNWSVDPNAAGILNNFANSLAGSGYYNVLTQYYSGNTPLYISNSVIASGSTTSTYVASKPTNLDDSDIQGIVQAAISSQSLPLDPNGVYFVLTAPGVAESSGFLSSYCGWHNAALLSGAEVKYAFVGDPGNNQGCSAQSANSPNGDPPVDAMISVIAHELAESVTDPTLIAWYDTDGDELADKCAWNFGTTFKATNGSTANITLGSFDFLIQELFSNAKDSCVMTYAGGSSYTVSVSPASQTAAQSATTGDYTVTVNPTNGFNKAVTLSVTGLPAGATANLFTPNPASTSSSFTVNAGTAAAGTSTLTITGASGSLSYTAQATLVVTTTVPPPDFSLSVAVASQTVVQGNATANSYVVTVTPINGFSSTPTLTVTSPAGTLVNWPGLTSFTVTTSPSTMIGSYPLTITGVSGSLTHSITATLVVSPAGSLAITLTPPTQIAQGQGNATYTVTVSNQTGASTTSGAVTVTETAPAGVTLVSMSGTNWTCAGSTCTRRDALAGGSSYGPIAVTLNVASSTPSPVINQVSVSGGGSLTATARSITTITASVQPPSLVTVFSPAQGAASVSLTPALMWSAAAGAASYDVYFGTATMPPLVANTTTLSYSPPGLSPSTTYYWYLVSKNTAGSAPSAVWAFTTAVSSHPPFFAGEAALGEGVYWLQFPNGNLFGYYNSLAFPILYHYDMGFEAFIDGGKGAAYLYDFSSGHWFYTSSSLFPYLYDFTLNSWLYYLPNTTSPGHYTTNPRSFSNLTTGKIFTM